MDDPGDCAVQWIPWWIAAGRAPLAGEGKTLGPASPGSGMVGCEELVYVHS